MAQYINKVALVAEIKRLLDKYISVHTFNYGATKDLNHLLSFIDTLEVKEVDLNEEIEKCLKRHNMLALGKKDFTDIAKHFFELGLNTQQNISIDLTDIDKVFEENGVDPNSKEAKMFKESYYMALEKFKAQKGE